MGVRELPRLRRFNSGPLGLIWLAALSLATALCGADFVLVDERDNRAFGPYKYASKTPVLDGAWTLDLAKGNAVWFRQSSGTQARIEGPFACTNGTALQLAGRNYRLVLDTADLLKGLEIGRQTAALRAIIMQAQGLDDPRAGIEMIEQAQKTNSLARNAHEVKAACAKLDEKVRQEDLKLARGLEKFDGQWFPKEEAEKLRKQRQEDGYRAQGLELYEGEWLAADVIAERKRVLAEQQKQAAILKRRQDAARRCKRCEGTGQIYFEIHPPVAGAGTGSRPTAPLRIERAGLPRDTTYATERAPCPDCDGKGMRD